jgi:hypothetical protein
MNIIRSSHTDEHSTAHAGAFVKPVPLAAPAGEASPLVAARRVAVGALEFGAATR